jgi:hypothetical protein
LHHLRDSWLKVTIPYWIEIVRNHNPSFAQLQSLCHPILSHSFCKKDQEREREREKEKKEKTFLRYNLTIATKFHIKEDRNFAGSSVV